MLKNRGCLIAALICLLVLIVIVGTLAIGGVVMVARTGTLGEFGWHMRNFGLHMRDLGWSMPSLRGFPAGSWSFPVLVGQALSMGRWLFTLVVAVLALVTIPRHVSRMALEAGRDPVRAFGWGILAVLSAWLATVLLVITVIGIPLAMLLALVLTFVRAIGYAAVGLVLGQRVRVGFGDSGSGRNLVDVVIGLALLFIVSWVPILGWLVSFVAGTIAVGIVILTSFGTVAERGN